MAKLPLRGSPVMTLVQLALGARKRWTALHAEDRRELGRILAKAKGGPSALTAKDKAELRRIVRLLDVAGLGMELVPFGRRLNQARKGRR